jgi:mono/diheme cytochrome c family protein
MSKKSLLLVGILFSVICVAGTKSWVAPRFAVRKKSPVQESTATLRKGLKLYKEACLNCHGETGAGDGMAALASKIDVPILSSTLIQSQSDGSLFWKIGKGRNQMAGYENLLSDNDRWYLVQYIRTLPKSSSKKNKTKSFSSKASSAKVDQSSAGDTGWESPRYVARKKNPVPQSAAALRKGKKLYSDVCLSCHGKTGAGDGLAAKASKLKIARLSNRAIQSQSDGSLFWKISEGRGKMAGYKTLMPEQDRWKLVHYIRSMKNHKPSPKAIARGKELYITACLGCHGEKGHGKGASAIAQKMKVPDLLSSKVLGKTDKVLFSSISVGRKPMPGYGETVSKKDIWNLVDFIRNFTPIIPSDSDDEDEFVDDL